MLKKYAKMFTISFLIGMAPFMPGLDSLPLFAKDEIEKVEKKDDGEDKPDGQ